MNKTLQMQASTDLTNQHKEISLTQKLKDLPQMAPKFLKTLSSSKDKRTNAKLNIGKRSLSSSQKPLKIKKRSEDTSLSPSHTTIPKAAKTRCKGLVLNWKDSKQLAGSEYKASASITVFDNLSSSDASFFDASSGSISMNQFTLKSILNTGKVENSQNKFNFENSRSNFQKISDPMEQKKLKKELKGILKKRCNAPRRRKKKFSVHFDRNVIVKEYDPQAKAEFYHNRKKFHTLVKKKIKAVSENLPPVEY